MNIRRRACWPGMEWRCHAAMSRTPRRRPRGLPSSWAAPAWVVKSQIHAGGRGAGRFKDNPRGKGGVRVVRSIDDVVKNVGEMVGHVLVTKQTGPAGREVKRVYIEEGCDIERELYLGMLIDRATSRVTLMASTEGGMEIEE